MKKETTIKEPVKKEATKKENVKNELELKNNNKIITLMYIIIALLAINTIILLISNLHVSKDTTSKETNTEVKEPEYDVSMFNTIDPDKFLDLVDGEKASVIYLGRSTCGYCVKFLPTLQKAQKEVGYKTNYVDIENIDQTSKSFEKMVNLIDGMSEKYNEKNGTDYESLYGYTPTVVVVKNGKIKDIWIGYAEYDAYVNWLKENGIK